MPIISKHLPASKGFTLIELLVVIALIAILSVVSVTLYSKVTSGARDSRRKADIEAIAKAYEVQKGTGYIALQDSHFASGKKPTDPSKGEYFNWLATDGSGFKVCAALDNNPSDACNTPALNCYCKQSSQGAVNPSSPYDPSSTQYLLGLGGSSGSSCDSNGTLLAGLAGYWKMDETTSPFLDYSGNNNSGTWAGGVGTAPGVRVSPYDFKNAGNFDGVNSYVDGIGASLQNLPNVTIAAWVNPTATPVFGNVVAKYSYANGGMILRISQNSSGGLTPHVYTDTWYTCSGSVIGLNVWTHVAIRYDGTTLKGYVNGLEDCTTTPAVGGNLSLNPTAFLIDTTGGDHFPGLIDDVRIYNRALSPDEVQDLYGRNPPGSGCLPS